MVDEPTRNPYADIAPALGEYTETVLFGDVWKRPGLIELVTLLAFYAGWPAAKTAVCIARGVFGEAREG